MKKIQVNVSENKYRMFEVIDRLPELESLEDLKKETYPYPDERCIEIYSDIYLDPEQPSDEVYDYNLYELKMFDVSNYEAGENVEDYIDYRYVAIKKEKTVIKMNNFGDMVDDGVKMLGYDEEGNEYSVYFDLLEIFNKSNPDLSESCDWNNPREAWLDGEQIDLDKFELEY